MAEQTAYIGVYRTKEGKFRCSEFVHNSEACVMRSIPLLEGTQFMGIFPITIDPLAKSKGSGMMARINWEKANPNA